MNNEQKERIELLTTFCGYGDPECAHIFFMGIEEHNTLECIGKNSIEEFARKLVKIQNARQQEYTYLDSLGGPNGASERMQCNIFVGLTGDASFPEDVIFRNQIHCFNYYPLGAKRHKEYPSQYNECLGFDFKSKSEWYDYFDNHTDRKKILRAFITEEIIKKNNVLFVLGKSCWNKVEELLPDVEFKNSFSDWSKKSKEKPSMIRWSNDGKIWLTGHPSYGWINYEVIEKIADIRNDIFYPKSR